MTENEHADPAQWMMVAVRPQGRRVVIVGSGAVARRRAEQFVSRGAQVDVYDPRPDENQVEQLPAGITMHTREAQRGDLEDVWLVVVATSDPEVNSKIGEWASQMGVACNRTDNAESGDFAVPAIMEDDLGWKVAVLGGDAGPLFSAWVKGLVGQMAASERIGQVYTAMASARYAAETLPVNQPERAFLLRKAMARVLETTEEVDGAALVRKLHSQK